MPPAGMVLSQQPGRSRSQFVLLPLVVSHMVMLPLRKIKALLVAAYVPQPPAGILIASSLPDFKSNTRGRT